jgi:hypothetical protein
MKNREIRLEKENHFDLKIKMDKQATELKVTQTITDKIINN